MWACYAGTRIPFGISNCARSVESQGVLLVVYKYSDMRATIVNPVSCAMNKTCCRGVGVSFAVTLWYKMIMSAVMGSRVSSKLVLLVRIR